MSSAVIAIVKGGLGNQLFIYATARALALRTKRTLYLDTARGYTKDDYGRSYRLDRFPNLKAQPMPEEWRIAPTLKHPQHKIIRALNKLLPRDQRTYFAEQRNSSPQQLTALQPQRARITLLGYWQNEAYFADHADIIQHELTPSPPQDAHNRELGLQFSDSDTVFIHFRRVKYEHLLTTDYYQPAINTVCNLLRRPKFALFGDDLNWPRAKLDFHGHRVETITHNPSDELADLWLMTQCSHAIVANSSFSWWGAWLGASGRPRSIMAPRATGYPVCPSGNWTILPNTLDGVTNVL